MAINPKIMNAILSMDSYNRGYDAGIDLRLRDLNNNYIVDSDTLYEVAGVQNYAKIGSYNVIDRNGNANAIAQGFYGIAYKDNSSTIISYRGTDNPFGSGLPGNDIINGWVTGGGTLTSQVGLALEFYREVLKNINGGAEVDPRAPTTDISFTGHSLGGGLAGLVASVYLKNATMFDNMAFEQATENIYDYATVGGLY